MNRSASSREPALDQPELRPHLGWSKVRGALTRKSCYRSAKLDQDICRGHLATCRTPALVSSSRKRTSFFSFAGRRASDLKLYCLVEWRSEQLKAYRARAGGIFPGEPLDEVLSEYQKIPRYHVKCFVSAPIARMYLIRGLGRSAGAYFLVAWLTEGQR